MTWLVWVSLVLCVSAAATVGLSAYGLKRWTESMRTLTSKLNGARIDEKTRPPSRPSTFDSRELDGLPAPVRRYFRAVLKEGQPVIAAVTVDMAGTFNLSATGAQWKPFTSKQRIIIWRPGFLWEARVAMLPGVAVRVVDSYIAGEGLLRAAVLGLFPVADAHGGGELARGEFMRYFAEAAWYPTALLPSQGVQWKAVDHASANATIVDGPLKLTLLFRFNDAGLIDSFRAEARGAGAGKDMVMLPWEGHWSDYRTHDGMTVPFTGEVAWVRPEGRKPYFRGNVTSLTYEFRGDHALPCAAAAASDSNRLNALAASARPPGQEASIEVPRGRQH